MSVHITSVVFMEIIIGAVTVVWIINFGASLIMPTYDGSQYNQIFMAIVGPGLAASAFSRLRSGKDDGGNKS